MAKSKADRFHRALLTSKRKQQLRAIQPDPADLEAYQQQINVIHGQYEARLSQYAEMMEEVHNHNNAVIEQVLTPAKQKCDERMAQIQADFAKLIGPLEAYRDDLVKERDALLAHVANNWNDLIQSCNNEALEQRRKNLVMHGRMDKDAIRIARETEQALYEDLKAITREKKSTGVCVRQVMNAASHQWVPQPSAVTCSYK